MTPQQIEALKLALEALETCEWVDDGGNGHAEFDPGKVIAAAMEIKEALAEHAMRETQRLGQKIEQEPVPVTDNTYGYAKSLAEAIFKQHFSNDEHYASGRIVWGVNDSVIGILTQIDNMVADMVRRPEQPERHELQAKGEHPAPCARHCEANAFKIVIKNLKAQLAQPEQEPVAIERMKEWIEYLKYLKRTSDQHMKIPSEMSAGTCWELALELEQFINTTPPQRTWVGLTDEDMYVVSEEESCSFIAGAKWSEEILKEKNAICSPFMISELWRLNK